MVKVKLLNWLLSVMPGRCGRWRCRFVMAKSHTVDVMKEVETLQQQETVDLKHEMSPDSAVPSELCVGEVTESSETAEAPLKTDQDIIEKCLKTVAEQLGKDQGVIDKRLKSVEEWLEQDLGKIEKSLKTVAEQLGKDQEVIDKHLKTVESFLPKRSQGLQANISVNEKDSSGRTQLMWAVDSRDIIKITLLLKRGADANIGDNRGWSSLHYAASNGFADVCALLLLMGNADINAKTKANETPLHTAACYGTICVVELLLKFGADVNLKSSKGKTAYDGAVEYGHKEIARLLDCAINRGLFASSLNQSLTK